MDSPQHFIINNFDGTQLQFTVKQIYIYIYSHLYRHENMNNNNVLYKYICNKYSISNLTYDRQLFDIFKRDYNTTNIHELLNDLILTYPGKCYYQ